MKRFFTVFSTLLLALFAVTPAFAAEAASDNAMIAMYSALAAAFAMSIAAAACAIGQGLGLKSACEGTARNPEAMGKIMVILILGLAFIESLAIYSFVINLILLVANPFI